MEWLSRAMEALRPIGEPQAFEGLVLHQRQCPSCHRNGPSCPEGLRLHRRWLDAQSRQAA